MFSAEFPCCYFCAEIKVLELTWKFRENFSGIYKNTTSKTASFSGKGTADVVLTITDDNGGNWVRTQNINFNNVTTIAFQ